MSFIRLENVSKKFGDGAGELSVIRKLQWQLPQSGMIAIVGRSGIGKSTLLHLIGGLESVSSGEIWIGDRGLHTLSEEQLSAFRVAEVGFVFQFHHLLPEFNAIENVAMPLLIAGVAAEVAYQQAGDMLARVGLSSRKQHRPGMLSGGEQQRVAVARALVHRPQLVLCDEPTGNLDPQTAQQIQDLLREIHHDLQNLVIIVTHSHELARNMDEAYEMVPGGELHSLPHEVPAED